MLFGQGYSYTSKNLEEIFHNDLQEAFGGFYEDFALYEMRNELDTFS
jgi:hypothetical protein